ncbi:acyltransferase family protein [Dyadobacter fanqingshengii]|uniref:Acyltransferase n=1 Tax=Dyadobacter fanqingshengii TaxID=2906443 RepID=A0A9X1PDU2_9BACT|nr:acyltransferase [Dyadobacter fanqingshengii]MCF0041858.1 acyltransferase [Dyadobacter fanqingshengii]USJ36433.1 acyltransferase [Dyadobacter fanqingshengii]
MSKSPLRIHSLDYLRGLAALGIMFYHMHLLNFGETDASSPLAVIKIYAVAIFFILSGLTLYKVYFDSFNTNGIRTFFIKRILRIVPLLWLATILTFLLSEESYTLKKMAVNMLVLPGILKPEMFVANGAWSIGNELGFYVLFPVILLLTQRNVNYLILLLIAFLIPFFYFTYIVLDPASTLGAQWSKYVSPLNQFVFFLVGMGLGALRKPHPALVKFAPYFASVVVIALFTYPVQGEPIQLAAGNNRIVFSALTTLLCYLIYIADFSFLPASVQWGLSTLGEISYSVYLIHPIVFVLTRIALGNIAVSQPYLLIGITITASLIVSYFLYQYFEKYFMGLAKHFKKPVATAAVLVK